MGDSDYSDTESVADKVENDRNEIELENSSLGMNTTATLSLFTSYSLVNALSGSSNCIPKKLIALRRKNLFFISGFCRITLLKGSLEINGHHLVYGKQVTVKNPAWMPCCRAIASSSSPSNRDFEKLLQSHCVSAAVCQQCNSTLSEDSPFSCVFLLEAISSSEQEWMIAAEDQSQYSQENVLKRLCIGRSKSEQDLLMSRNSMVQDCSLCSVGSGMIGSADHMKSLKLELMSYPESWTTAVESVCTAIGQSSLEQGDSSGTSQIKIVICGAKGVGKSSCLRYAVNSVLSQCRSSVEAVCVIDCDIGQPEFTVPGLISLQIVACPILEANHFNMHRSMDVNNFNTSSSSSGSVNSGVSESVKNIREGIRRGRNQVLCSYYLGDLTTKNDPELLIACLRRLLDQYATLKEQYQAAEMESLSKQQVKKTSSSSNLNYKGSSGNNFSVLMADEDEERRSKKRRIAAAAAASAVQPVKVLPLLVNTDGFIRFMGEEVLFNVLSSVRPSHIFQFSSRNDTKLASVERYKTLLREESRQQQGDPQQTDNQSEGGHAEEGDDVIVDGVTVRVLSAGRESPSKRHATDLRDLRLVSYFLGGGSSSSGAVGSEDCDPLKLKHRVRGSLLTADDSSSSSGDSIASNSGLYMSSNILVDLEGTLAVSLLKLTTLVVPFDKVAVQSISGVSVSKFLAALNGSVVGIVQLPKGVEGEVVPLVSHKLRVGVGEGRGGENGSITLHTVPAIPGAKLLPCLGVAVVKCIDVVNQYFAVTAPPATIRRIIEATSSPAAARDGSTSRRFDQPAVSTISIAIVKGEASQQLPNVLLYAPGMPCYPYLSSESAGEGSSKMKARNNVKRRSQQKLG